MTDLLTLLKNANTAPPAKTRVARATHTRDELWGSGLTKRLAERQVSSVVDVDDKVAYDPAAADYVPEVSVFERSLALTLDESQQAAVDGILAQQQSCLIGSAGTGKTTVTLHIVAGLERLHQDTLVDYDNVSYNTETKMLDIDTIKIPGIAICAPTGAAVRQSKRVFPKKYAANCSTIHKLLGFHPVFYTTEEESPDGEVLAERIMRFEPYFTAMNKLPHKIIIIDEASMCTVELWNQLYEACHDDVKIIMVGDINQLPPVYGKSILGYAMQTWPTYELSKIHRNAGLIIRNAASILEGNLAMEQVRVTDATAPEDDVFQIITMPIKPETAYEAARKAVMILAKNNQFDYKQDIFIVPENNRLQGRNAFNTDLSMFFNQMDNNPNRPVPINTGFTDALYTIGDKVMVTKNFNDIGLTNGMIGWVTDITLNGAYRVSKGSFNPIAASRESNITLSDDDISELVSIKPDHENKENITPEDKQRQASHIVTVKFDGDIEHAFHTAGELSALTHAYAITCHKAQGSEFPTVCILVHHYSTILHSREWLYTAITRAKHKVFLLCTDRGLAKSITRQRIKGNTLEEKVSSFIMAVEEESKTNNGPYPILEKYND